METKAKQLRKMSNDEIMERQKSLEESLLRERSAVAMGGAPASPGKIRSIRRQLARIYTVLGEGEKN